MPKYKTTEYTLKKRGDSWQFNVRAFNPETGTVERIRRQSTSEEEARRAVELIIDRAEAGANPIPPTAQAFATPTLKRIYDLVYASQWKGSKGERTAKINAETCLKIIGESTPIDKVTTDVVDNLIIELKDKGLEPGTIRRKLAALSTLLKYAASRHHISAIPLIDRKSAGKERKRLRYLSDEEEKTALEYLKFIGKNHEFFAFLIDTGLRLSEAVNLKLRQVHKDKDGLPEYIGFDFDNKGEQPRMVPCTIRVKTMLKTRLKALPQGEQRVWHDMTCHRAEYEWKMVRENMGLLEDEDFVIHSLRHTFASRLAQAGTPLNVIKDLGGWKTLDMVLRYAHLDNATKLNAIQSMEQRRKIG